MSAPPPPSCKSLFRAPRPRQAHREGRALLRGGLDRGAAVRADDGARCRAPAPRCGPCGPRSLRRRAAAARRGAAAAPAGWARPGCAPRACTPCRSARGSHPHGVPAGLYLSALLTRLLTHLGQPVRVPRRPARPRSCSTSSRALRVGRLHLLHHLPRELVQVQRPRRRCGMPPPRRAWVKSSRSRIIRRGALRAEPGCARTALRAALVQLLAPQQQRGAPGGWRRGGCAGRGSRCR